LTNIGIGNGVTSIGDYAFSYCLSLSRIGVSSHVTRVGTNAFYYCLSLTNVYIGSGVSSIASYAFYNCPALRTVYFQGNAPAADSSLFYTDSNVTVYYLPGTTGWLADFSGMPTALWNPHATSLTTLGGHFGFTIAGPASATIVVMACTNLSHPVWLPVSTNLLAGGSSSFSDPLPASFGDRFYRFSSP